MPIIYWVIELSSSHTTEYYSVMQKNKTMIHIVIEVDPSNIKIFFFTKAFKITHCIVPLEQVSGCHRFGRRVKWRRPGKVKWRHWKWKRGRDHTRGLEDLSVRQIRFHWGWQIWPSEKKKFWESCGTMGHTSEGRSHHQFVNLKVWSRGFRWKENSNPISHVINK